MNGIWYNYYIKPDSTACGKESKYRFGSLLTALPATFMTAVSTTYILTAKEGFQQDTGVSYLVGACAAALLLGIYSFALARRCRK